jgi:hypothetical protein
MSIGGRMLERMTGIEPAHASLATTRVTLTHPHVGCRDRICTYYLALIRGAQVCICSTASIGLDGRTRTCMDMLPRHVVNL